MSVNTVIELKISDEIKMAKEIFKFDSFQSKM